MDVLTVLLSGVLAAAVSGMFGWLSGRSTRKLEHELRLAEGQRAKLRELQAPRRQAGADALARSGHAVLRGIEGSGMIAANFGPPDIEGNANRLRDPIEEFRRCLDEFGYLLTDTDRDQLRKMLRDVDLVRIALLEEAEWDGPTTPEPPTFPEPGTARAKIDEVEGRLAELMRALDVACRRLSGADFLDARGDGSEPDSKGVESLELVEARQVALPLDDRRSW